MKQIKLNVTGETITFTKTGADTNGAFLEMVCFLPAGKKSAPPKHIHPFQNEYFEALEGQLGIFIGHKRKILLPGQSDEVPPNTKHGWYAAGNTDIKFKTVFKPALNIEWLLTETFASMNRANSTRPSIFDASYILTQMKGQFYLAAIPISVQKIIFPILSKIGKFFGLVKYVNSKTDLSVHELGTFLIIILTCYYSQVFEN